MTGILWAAAAAVLWVSRIQSVPKLLTLTTEELSDLRDEVVNTTILSEEGDVEASVEASQASVARVFENGGFVHIGKTGGSSLTGVIRNACHSFMPHPCSVVANETLASKLLTSYYHVPDFHRIPQSQHDFYLVTLRDPFSRAVSTFVYEHFLNRKARGDRIRPVGQRRELEKGYRCFPTLESFVKHLEGNSSDFIWLEGDKKVIGDVSCRDLARASIHGQVRLFEHYFFNFQRIKALMPTPTPETIFVTRQELLWEDWTAINAALGQTEGVTIPARRAQDRNFSHMELPVTKDLSAAGTETLCTALQAEFDAYLWFLRRGANVLPSELEEAIDRIRKRCPNVTIT